MALVDLKDAYFSPPVHKNYQKYLKFVWRGVLYKFTCMPKGLACAPRLFTKLLKTVYAHLRSKGHVSSGYLDDSLLEGDTYQSCADNVTTTVNLFDSLGFSPHQEKSIIFPPFSIIPRILQKIEEDQAQALMIVPLWATQPWFPKITCRPRYQFMWDTSIVLNYLRDLPSLQDIKLKTLTLKLIILCALVTGQKCQSIHLMNLEQMFIGPEFCKFVINDIVKQSAPGRAQPELVIPVFPAEPKLCVCTYLREYIKRTEPLRGEETRLFISYIRPHKWVSKDTIARWVKIVMQQAGVDERLFKPHSTRAASTSKAYCANVPLASIIKAGSWKSDCVFQKLYNKPIYTWIRILATLS